MIAVIDYGAGNLFSVCNALKYLNIAHEVTKDAAVINRADAVILPGVGAFEDAAVKLKESGIAEVIKEEAASGKPLLGICLGMQLLFDRSLEYGEHDGLGLIKGVVKPMEGLISPELKIPHIGWNPLIIKKEHPLFSKINNGDCVYFVHSFFADECEDAVIATAEYDIELTAAVAKDNIMGCQFHPEKSGDVGLDILRAFCKEM